MNARDTEADLLSRCVRISRGEVESLDDERVANVVRVAAILARPRNPAAADRLREAADAYFARNPDSRRSADELIRLEWLISFPRFREQLDARLGSA